MKKKQIVKKKIAKREIAKVRPPNNFKFEIKSFYNNESVYVYLIDKKKHNRKVGEVRLYDQHNGFYATHSNLDDEYHGRGLGTKLYARAIQWCLENGFKVRSSGGSSPEAQRVWKSKSLRKYFYIRTKKKEFEYQSSDTWFAYAKKKSA